MTDERTDMLMHERLKAIGADLPEPTLSPEARRAILSGEARVTTLSPTSKRLRVTVVALGAAAACLAVATGLVTMQNTRLRGELESARSGNEAAARSSLPVADNDAEAPSYMLVNLFHEGCSRAAAMRPHVQELKSRFGDADVLFVDLDVTNPDDAKQLASCLGVGCVFQGAPAMESGTVKLVDRKTHRVICSEGPEDGLERTETIMASLKETR